MVSVESFKAFTCVDIPQRELCGHHCHYQAFAILTKGNGAYPTCVPLESSFAFTSLYAPITYRLVITASDICVTIRTKRN
jgi:hypothetical protein